MTSCVTFRLVNGPRSVWYWPALPVRPADVWIVVTFAAGVPPGVGPLEVHAQLVFAPRRLVGILAREVQAPAAGEIRVPENVRCGEAVGTEPVCGNPAGDAAVRET